MNYLHIRRMLLYLVFTLFFIHGLSGETTNQKKGKSLKEIYKTGKIEFVPELKITRESFPEPAQFKGVTGIAPGKEHIYLVDPVSCKINMFNASGKFVKSFGQEGKNGGDLWGPGRMVFRENNLIVWENWNRRFSIFTPDGKFKNFVKVKPKGYVWDMKVLDNGGIILERYLTMTMGEEYYEFFTLELYSRELEFIEMFYKKQVFRRKYLPKANRKILLPFSPDASWDVLPGNKIAVAYSDKYDIEILEPATEKSRTFSHPYTPEKITEADKTYFFNGLISTTRSFHMENTEFPDQKPAFQKIITDSEGNILVFLYKGSSKLYNAGYFDAFDSSGNFINRVKIAPEEGIFIYKLFSGESDVFWATSMVTDTDVGVVKYRLQ